MDTYGKLRELLDWKEQAEARIAKLESEVLPQPVDPWKDDKPILEPAPTVEVEVTDDGVVVEKPKRGRKK